MTRRRPSTRLGLDRHELRARNEDYRHSRYRRPDRPLVTCESQGSGDRGSGPGAARVSPAAASWAEEARPMTVSWVTPIASGSSRAGIAGIWAGPETEVTGRPRSSVSCCAGPLRGVEGQAPFPRLPPGTAVRDRSQTAGGLAGWGLRGPARWPSPGRLGRPSGCAPFRGRAARMLSYALRTPSRRFRLHWAGALCRPRIGARATPAST